MSVLALPIGNDGDSRGEYRPSPTPAARTGFSLGDLQAMAQAAADSGMFPGITTPKAALALMLLCQSEGLHPMQAMRRYHIIEGRPAMRADAMQAEFQARGGWIRWTAFSADEAAAVFGHKAHCPEGVQLRVTFQQFDEAGITRGKYGIKDNWKKFPDAMLRARLISAGVRMVDPGCITGMYAPEEVVDFGPDGLPPEVATPPAAPPAINNNSGHGRGTYASPEQERAYGAKLNEFLAKKNAEWADRWMDRETGEPIDGVPELMNPWQANAHLVKWAIACGRLDASIVPEDAKSRQAKNYPAIIYHRSTEDRKALTQELARYVAEEARLKTEAVYRKFPELDPDHAPADAGDDQVIDVTDDDTEPWEPGAEG